MHTYTILVVLISDTNMHTHIYFIVINYMDLTCYLLVSGMFLSRWISIITLSETRENIPIKVNTCFNQSYAGKLYVCSIYKINI